MEKLTQLFKEYMDTTNPKFTDKKSKFYLASGFSEWLEDRYNENYTQLAQECGFPTNAELRLRIHTISSI